MRSFYHKQASLRGGYAEDRHADFPVRAVWNPVKGGILFSTLERILTIDNLRDRGAFSPNRCTLGKHAEESVSHVLIHCPFSVRIWE